MPESVENDYFYKIGNYFKNFHHSKKKLAYIQKAEFLSFNLILIPCLFFKQYEKMKKNNEKFCQNNYETTK
jgi:hypothetical protein